MTILQAYVLGVMTVLTPSMIVVAVLLWRAPIVDDDPIDTEGGHWHVPRVYRLSERHHRPEG